MKYSGKIGFWQDDVEIRPGVSKPQIMERDYTGDIIRSYQRWNQSQDGTNDNLKVNNNISIISDLYLLNNVSSIKYVTFMGVKWRVSAIELKYPRVNIELGEEWNGDNT